MRVLLVAVTGAVALLVSPGSAFACVCIPPLPPRVASEYREWLKDFDGLVFRGTVVGVESDGPELKVMFRVERHWKGVTTPEIVIRTALNEAACGVEFAPGSSYLVAAVPLERPRVSLCESRWFRSLNERVFSSAVGEGSPPPKP